MTDNLEEVEQRLADRQEEVRRREEESERRKQELERRTRVVNLLNDRERRRELFTSK